MKTWDLERRIRRVWQQASPIEHIEGRDWYHAALRDCTRVANMTHAMRLKDGGVLEPLTTEQVAGVVAAISPGLRWERNVFWAQTLIEAWYEGTAESVKVPTYSYGNVRKALRIIAGEAPETVLAGPKVTAFHRLIVTGGTDPGTVCIDGHAYAIAQGAYDATIRGEEAIRISKPELRRVHAAYLRLAPKLGVSPSTLQATTWLAWRRMKAEVPF